MKKLLNAKLVWDGGDEVRIPSELGTPADNQMKGTPAERLSELAGRTCYDSLGRGRSSEEYHKHILEVKHGSVYEHFNKTLCVVPGFAKTDLLLNRPGIWTVFRDSWVRITLNPRTILDWNYWTRLLGGPPDLVGVDYSLGDILSFNCEKIFPQIVQPRERKSDVVENYVRFSSVVAPENDEEQWVSMFMSGSRGFSHELVRHKFRTAVSQRSTRFVSEDESDWVDHPLVIKYCESLIKEKGIGDFMDSLGDLKTEARKVYSDVVERLQGWITKQGVDKLTARKQARGAARGYLGNALYTELIFSASVAQWKRMLRMRCSAPADAEIREVFAQALQALKGSRYAHCFEKFELQPSPDGLGQIAVEK